MGCDAVRKLFLLLWGKSTVDLKVRFDNTCYAESAALRYLSVIPFEVEVMDAVGDVSVSEHLCLANS
jgi:hypothetical protein